MRGSVTTSQIDGGAIAAAAIAVLLGVSGAIGLATSKVCRMMFRKLAGLGLTALLLTGGICVAGNMALPAAASARTDAKAEKKAAEFAGKTRKALARQQWGKAIATAEATVALSGEDPGYRFLLGTSYLRGGRFASAEQAFSDALTLRPDDGAAALQLALAQIATGGWDKARATLEQHRSTIPIADRGLALALAGDPAGAVEVLAEAVRSGGADAKTRQNLALAFALSGKWVEARTLAGVDLPPADADRRIMDWAAFARPAAAADQVAALLGVTPVADPGQPVAIALVATVPVGVALPIAPAEHGAVPAPASVDAFIPGRAADPVEAAVLDVPPMPVVIPPPARVIVSIPVPPPAAAPAPRVIEAPRAYKVAAKLAPQQLRGRWVVQIGTYGSSAAARSGWTRAVRRLPRLARHQPNGSMAWNRSGSFYRLSVGGFPRGTAIGLCRGYRDHGGKCFVRPSAGDQVASWARRERVQYAAR